MLTSGAFGYLADYLLGWFLFLSLVVHTWCYFRFFPRRRWRWLGLLAGNMLVFLCLAGAVALAAESYLRFVSVRTDAFGVSLPARRWFALYTRLNSLGCRDEEWSREKPPGVRRIAFVGDSFTYGWGIERVEDRFTDRIQAKLDQRSPGAVQVMNVAKPGWGTVTQRSRIQDMIAHYQVDEVVLCHVANDIEDVLPLSETFNPTRPPEPRLFNPDSSCLLDFLYRRIWLPRVSTVSGYHAWLARGFAEPDVWQRHWAALADIVGLCREHHVTLRVVLIPFVLLQGKEFSTSQVHERLRQSFEETHTQVLDLEAALTCHDRSTLVVNRDDPHPNARAHALFAEAIWRAFYEPGTN